MLTKIFAKINKTHLSNWIIALFFLILTLLYLGGIAKVPFHPDESTQIFMSSDLNQLLTRPSALFWQADLESDPRQIYRELDAPITRYLIGIGRSIMRLPALPVDWNWSDTWQENVSHGALPGDALLLTSRFSVAFLFPFCLFLIYRIGKSIDGQFTGIIAAVLFASNALILLHTRRAMAESALTFGILLTVLTFLNADQKPWLAALSVAIAYNSKQLAIALLPVGFVAIYLLGKRNSAHFSHILVKMVIYLFVFIGVTYLLNPLLWQHPIQATIVSLQARQDLLNRQIADLRSVAPDQLLMTPVERFAAFLAHCFMTPPAIEDIGNYTTQLAQAKAAYFSSPFTQLLRGFFWGGISAILSIWGFIISIQKKGSMQDSDKVKMVIFGTSFIAELIFLLATISIPYQRYWLPLIPFTCLLCALTINWMIQTGKTFYRQRVSK